MKEFDGWSSKTWVLKRNNIPKILGIVTRCVKLFLYEKGRAYFCEAELRIETLRVLSDIRTVFAKQVIPTRGTCRMELKLFFLRLIWWVGQVHVKQSVESNDVCVQVKIQFNITDKSSDQIYTVGVRRGSFSHPFGFLSWENPILKCCETWTAWNWIPLHSTNVEILFDPTEDMLLSSVHDELSITGHFRWKCTCTSSFSST